MLTCVIGYLEDVNRQCVGCGQYEQCDVAVSGSLLCPVSPVCHVCRLWAAGSTLDNLKSR